MAKAQGIQAGHMTNERALIWAYRDAHQFGELLQVHLFKFVMRLERGRMQGTGTPTSALRVSWKPEVVRLRREGYTELLGSWFLRCTYQGTETPGRTPHLSVIVFLNTAITSRSDDPTLFEVGRPGAGAPVPCTGVHGNMVIFASVPLEGILPGETRVFQISNLRCNANLLWNPSGPDTRVMAFMSVTGTQIDQEDQQVAVVSRSLQFQARAFDGASSRYRQSVSLLPTPVAILTYIQCFPGAFKGRMPGEYHVHDGAIVAGGESPRFGSLYDSPTGIRYRGIADTGTRLQAVFNNVPDGLRVFVSVSNQIGLIANLVGHESTLLSGAQTETIHGLMAQELRVERGSARAVWEVTGGGWILAPHPTDFVVFAAYEADPMHNRPAPGLITLNGGFAPAPPTFSASTGAASCDSLPIPRFTAPWEAATHLLYIDIP